MRKIKNLSFQKPLMIVIFVLTFCVFLSYGHSEKAEHHILIDTDAAPDDLRALCLFLSSPDIEILAITTSDGALDPKEGLGKVQALLRKFGHEGIPTGRGRVIQKKIPPWRDFCSKVQWGDEKTRGLKRARSSVDVILSALEKEEDQVTFVCLGGLTNVVHALKAKPQIKKKIARIVWYNDSIQPVSGTNCDIDKEAVTAVFSMGIPLEVVSNAGKNAYVFNEKILRSIESADSSYAKRIVESHHQKIVLSRIKSNHLKLWDDLVPLFLLFPDLFALSSETPSGRQRLWKIRRLERIMDVIPEILDSREKVKSNVFKGFPDKQELFSEDVQLFMKDIIRRHGKEEWRVGVLTNELHGHLGIYAIIGAKMGLRARQYFNIGVEDITIISHAGRTPPISCTNDGLQVSTGSTLGHGLITVFQKPPFRPEAVFNFKGNTLRIRLKNQYRKKIQEDIQNGIARFGNKSDEYWHYVRMLALKYWKKWDRNEIFLLEHP